VILLKAAENINGLVGTTLLCHHGETNDFFPIGGLVQSGETLASASTRHCRHLVNFRIEQNDRLYIVKSLNGFKDHKLVKKNKNTDVLCGILQWRARHHTM